MDYKIPSGVYFFQGARNSVLCDTRNGKVYSLNSVSSKQIRESQVDSELARMLIQLDLLCIEKKEEEEKLVKSSELEFAWFEVTTSSCNLRCRHCYLGNPVNSFSKKRKMPQEQWREIIAQTYSLGVRSCQFIGGEPLLYNHRVDGVLDLCDYAFECGYKRVEIFSNLQLVTKELAQRIKSQRIRVATSLYSVVPFVHDSITGHTGSQEKTVSAIRLLKELGVDVRVEIVLMSLNQDTVEETISFLEQLGVRHRTPDPIRPTGFGSDEFLLPDEKYLYRYGLMLEPNFYASKRRILRNQDYNNCLANKFVVTENGDIFPCVFTRRNAYGNVRQGSVSEILNGVGARKVRKITKDSILVCQDCEYRYVCSDCRPLAADTYQTEDAFSCYPNPRCTYNPYTGVWGKGIWVQKNSKLEYEPFPSSSES